MLIALYYKSDAYEFRTERLFDANKPDGPTTASYHASQELRVAHEFKESVLEIISPAYDDKCVSWLVTWVLPQLTPSEARQTSKVPVCSNFPMASTRTLELPDALFPKFFSIPRDSYREAMLLAQSPKAALSCHRGHTRICKASLASLLSRFIRSILIFTRLYSPT